MDKSVFPADYSPALGIRETERAIKMLKDYFEIELANALNLSRVSAPLFVRPESGLNDNLNGFERPVSFDLKEQPGVCEIVHSLAKWKRQALARYGFSRGEGLYTDMNAIRRDEITDNLHSIYVDQWDWEYIIDKSERSLETLKKIVRLIYGVLLKTEKLVCDKYSYVKPELPAEITFVTSQELEDEYPDAEPNERERLASKKYGAIFLIGIGGKLKSGKIHDGRAPDYDDWSLNGDIIIYYPLLNTRFELSSMGVRVDEKTLLAQLKERGCEDRVQMPFQKALLAGELPYTVGGGIGQSRLCMYFLRKAHIGEVQASVWPDEAAEACKKSNINLL